MASLSGRNSRKLKASRYEEIEGAVAAKKEISTSISITKKSRRRWKRRQESKPAKEERNVKESWNSLNRKWRERRNISSVKISNVQWRENQLKKWYRAKRRRNTIEERNENTKMKMKKGWKKWQCIKAEKYQRRRKYRRLSSKLIMTISRNGRSLYLYLIWRK